jgi:hypothetical protein
MAAPALRNFVRYAMRRCIRLTKNAAPIAGALSPDPCRRRQSVRPDCTQQHGARWCPATFPDRDP